MVKTATRDHRVDPTAPRFILTADNVLYGLDTLTDTQVTILTGWIGTAAAHQVGEQVKEIFRKAVEERRAG